ncbi:hypothetical protein K458DRAFT_386714 [Lentithecium fluviatile CBS 122367]|uniref:Protein kinase domain-containing protein n=1 Tax=Lentithecium fluviatile CBS 122367 TaxID=1168545 RepID=A0A6G1J983_9PLEO|nr:hypothetical protein K458DRAFT_386714 [Lentithecium fluviatile CBS 122367]
MSKAGDREMEHGRHRHFSSTEDTHFIVAKQLGRGHYGSVDHVRSKFSKNIKPANILVKNDVVLITDFGTSRNWSDRSKGTTTGASGLYTLGCAAIEVVDCEARNGSSNIWSSGCIYLDIISVLKGETLVSKDQFFADNGNDGRNPRASPQAFRLWLSKLTSRLLGQLDTIWETSRKPENPSILGNQPLPRRIISAYEPEGQHFDLKIQPNPLAIHRAVTGGDYYEVHLHLYEDHDPNVRDEDDQSPLDLAIASGSIPLVGLLLKYGADSMSLDRNHECAYEKL